MKRQLLAAALSAPLLLSCPSPAAAGVRSVSLAARISYDVGGVFVSGTDSGFGGGVSLRLAFGDDRGVWEVGGELDVAGYVGEGDGDPIFTGAVLLGYRGFSDAPGTRTYWTAGVGIGGLAIAGGGLVLPLKVGAGLSLGHDEGAGLQIGVFERFNLVMTGGDPATDFINNLGIEAALRFGR